MTDLAFLSATELSLLIETGDVDPRDLTRLFLDRTNVEGRSLNCFITLDDESACVEASAAAERARSKRRLSPLDGIPVAVKDNMDIAGVPTSNGFGGVPYRIPPADLEVVRRLRAAGAIILGKLNMHEGALGATNDNPHFGRDDEPISRRAFTRRFERGIGSGCRGGAVRCSSWLRYRWLHPNSCILLRDGRAETQLRPRQHARCCSLELWSRSCRAADADSRRRRDAARRPCRFRCGLHGILGVVP